MTWSARRLCAILAFTAWISHGQLMSAAPRAVRDVAWDWRYVTGGRIRYAPAVSPDGLIYCGSDDRWLRALDLGGHEIWRTPLPARPLSSPVVAADGSILLATADRAVTRFGPQGRVRWRRILDRAVVAEPALAPEGGLYVALADGYLVSLDFAGRTRWSYRFNTPIAASPTAGAEGQVYVTTADRLLHALSVEGRELWATSLPGVGGAPSLGADGTVYVSVFGVHAFTAEGAPLWDFPVPFPTTDVVVGRGAAGTADVIVFAGRDGKVHRIGSGGERLEVIELEGEILGPPALRADGAIVVTTSRGVTRVYPEGGGEGASRVLTGATASRPALTPDGVAVVGSEDWVITALSFGDPPAGRDAPAAGPWPLARGESGNPGRAAREGSRSTYLVLAEMAVSGVPTLEERVLEEIGRHLGGEGYLDLDLSEMEDLLIRLAREGSVSRPSTGSPVLRALACELLGELGTPGARAALLAVVDRDPRREVQSSAAAALGRVGYDPEGSSGRVLGELAARSPQDTGLLLVVVRALREVAGAAGPTVGLGEAGARDESVGSRPAWAALVSIAVGGYPEKARSAARNALRELATGRSG